MVSNKTIAWLVIIFFILSPAIAWSVHYEHNKNVKDVLTKAYLYNSIAVYNKIPDGITPVQNITIDSFSCTDTIWCIAKVHNVDGDHGSMLFGSFYGDYSKIRVLTQPFAVAFHKNISGSLGVPYGVLDELNSSFGVKQ